MSEQNPGKLSNSAWCPHDLDTTADPKIIALLGKHGANGYAVFWRITEILHKEQDHKIDLADEFIVDAIAGQLKLDPSVINSVIDYCVHPCQLFNRDGNILNSERVMRNIGRKNEIINKRKEAGAKGGKSKANAKQVPSNGQPNAKQNVADKSRGEEIHSKGVCISDSSTELTPGEPTPSAPLSGAGSSAPLPEVTPDEQDQIMAMIEKVEERMSPQQRNAFMIRLAWVEFDDLKRMNGFITRDFKGETGKKKLTVNEFNKFLEKFGVS